jgi:uncharacterized protein (DUF302 family)
LGWLSALTGEEDVVTSEKTKALGSWRDLSIGYEQALVRLPEALRKEGFGIITEIDLQQTFKAKLGADFRRYRIFGACNPSFALRALQEDLRVGVLLPCNVVLYEKPDGPAVVGAVDPMQTIGAQGDGELDELAEDVGLRLERVLAALAA